MSRIAPLEPPYEAEIQSQFDRIMRGAPPLMLFRVMAGNPRAWEKFRAGQPARPRSAQFKGTRNRHRPHLRVGGLRIRMGRACRDICAKPPAHRG